MGKASNPAGAIKVSGETLELARTLLEHVSEHGWASIGIERKDPPSMGSLVTEGLRILEQRMVRKEKKR